MACGSLDWWRAITDDLESLVDRVGTVEHFLVQRDFCLLQPHRVPLAEFSIPGASWRSKKSGNAGFADIVSFASSEIWEIKPQSGGDKPAVDKATHYVKHAKAECGPRWELGKSYSTSSRDGVVFRLDSPYTNVELVAEQGQPGAVLYYWRVDGAKVKVLSRVYRLAVYKIVVDSYFTSPTPQRLPGAQPNDLPPGKWKPPVLRPESVSPVFVRILNAPRLGLAILQMVQTSFCRRILDGSVAAVGLDLEIYNSIVGPALVQQQTRMLEVRRDPTVTLYQQALLALTVAGGSAPVVTAIGLGGHWALTQAFALGPRAILATFRFVASSARAAKSASPAAGLPETLGASLRTSTMTRMLAPEDAFMLAFVTPHASTESPRTPVSLRASIPLIKVLTPYEAQRVNLGDSIEGDGKQGKIIALLGTRPG
jgi:hypothetical protein